MKILSLVIALTICGCAHEKMVNGEFGYSVDAVDGWQVKQKLVNPGASKSNERIDLRNERLNLDMSFVVGPPVSPELLATLVATHMLESNIDVTEPVPSTMVKDAWQFTLVPRGNLVAGVVTVALHDHGLLVEYFGQNGDEVAVTEAVEKVLSGLSVKQ